MTTENIIFIEEIIVILLLIASAVTVASRRLRDGVITDDTYSKLVGEVDALMD